MTGRPHVVAVDYGSKRNIFRNLVEAGARVTVVPASASFDEIMAHEPDGFFLSNGPGDPAATGEYAVPVIRQMLETKKPLFGICLGHQMLALAVGGRTSKMFQGHRGANHPVKRLADGRVEITSMNHGFAVEREGMPENVRETHVVAVRRQQLRDRADRPPGVQRPVSPRGEPGPAGQLLSVREVRGERCGEALGLTAVAFRSCRVIGVAEREEVTAWETVRCGFGGCRSEQKWRCSRPRCEPECAVRSWLGAQEQARVLFCVQFPEG